MTYVRPQRSAGSKSEVASATGFAAQNPENAIMQQRARESAVEKAIALLHLHCRHLRGLPPGARVSRGQMRSLAADLEDIAWLLEGSRSGGESGL